jgi:hypothetical protein
MRRLAMVLLVPSLLLLAAPAEGKVRRTCTPKGSRTVTKTATTRVYTVQRGGGGEYVTDGDVKLYGCLYARKKPMVLADLTNGTLLTSVIASQIQGSRVGIATVTSDEIQGKYDPTNTRSDWRVDTYDVATRTATLDVDQGETQIGSLVLSVGGNPAWVAMGPGGVNTVLASDANGQRTLDAGPIDPKSLGVAGVTVTWVNAGMQRSADLSS